jgi:hypothetical protein
LAAVLCVALPAAAQNLDLGARITASANAAEAFQGPLDGAWRLTNARGRTLYFIQIVDPVAGHPVEAVWRDRSGRVRPIDQAAWTGETLVLRFRDRESVRVVLRKAGGHWRGSIDRGGRRRAVILRR